MEKRKVYCENCKYFDDMFKRCLNENNFINKPDPIYEHNGIYPKCENVNTNNDCKYFKPKFFYKIKNIFKGE